jgi:hypothetical protein
MDRAAKKYDFISHAAALAELQRFFEERARLCEQALEACEAEDVAAYEVAMTIIVEQEAPESHDFAVDPVEARSTHWS